MTRNRVVVTGLGCITPLGNDVDTYWRNLLAGKSGAGRISKFDATGMKATIGAEVRNFNPADYIEEKEVSRMDPFSHFAVAAATQAVKDSGLDLSKCDRWRIGCIVASGIGGMNEFQEQSRRHFEKGATRVSPFFVPKMMVNAAAAQIAIRFGLGGPNWAVVSACASANHAMGSALRTIQYGDADVMLAGGSEAAMTSISMSGFANMQALSTRNDAPEKASRPFDKDRDGFVMGEGAAVLVFEKLEHALSRGARIYAELLGFGNTDDAYHITAPDPDGSGGATAMQFALRDAGLEPEQVSYVNAHGTSTPLNDKVETAAIKRVFGSHAKKLAISSTKSMIGHLLGAAAAAELVATVKSIQEDVVHPTINYETPDPECDLDYVPNQSRRLTVETAISNSLGFGGHNSVLVVGKFRN